ncbi:MAG: hypothetical protein Q9165_004436 [Trypethelium subeluteriae]
MTSRCQKDQPVSAAFFCPQTRAPKEDYLDRLRIFLRQNVYGQQLLEAIKDLQKAWSIFAAAKNDVLDLPSGSRYVQILVEWAANGSSVPVAEARSGIIALPLLVILQIGQYLQYLAYHGLSHTTFIAGVQKAGGLHGYCGGLPAAIAIACAKDLAEVIRHASTLIRILIGVGALGEAAGDDYVSGSTTLAIRLKYEGQGDDLVRHFPGTYISAITDPRSISIVGPASTLAHLYDYTQEQGLPAQKMDVTGKVHSPENQGLAAELCRICERMPCLTLPDASALQVCVRSNGTGEQLLNQSLMEEVITTVLASRCDWFSLLSEVAKDLKNTGCPTHSILIFGMSDCVPMLPFHRQRLQLAKIEAVGLIESIPPSTTDNKSLEPPMFPDDAIAIIGASCRLPGANSLDELWDLLSKGVDRHKELTNDRFDLHGSFRARESGAFVSERKFFGNMLEDVMRFDNSFFGMNAREAKSMDPQQRILLELSYEALEASGYLSSHRREAGDPVGCFIGASYTEYLDNTTAHGPTAYTATGTIRAFLSGRISYRYGWSGPSEVVDTACSSSLVAIHRACRAIQTGECSMVLAGGVNVITSMNNYFDLGKAGFLSPTGQCKPFDKSADGYCRSDGAGLIVLKSLKRATGEGDHILGVIPSIATNQGGLSPSITVPHSVSQRELYQCVLQKSGWRPDQVTYVEAHGTGTQAGDPIELESVRSVFGSSSRPSTLYIGSIKGNIGHCETAAGIAGLLKVLAMLAHGTIPPQASHHQLNPKIRPLDPDNIAIAKRLCPWECSLRTALVNSYGAAGSNCALLCCEWSRQRPNNVQAAPDGVDERSFAVILSAKSIPSLLASARAMATYISRTDVALQMGDVAYTLNERRPRHRFSMTFVASDTTKLAEGLGTSAPPMFEYPQKTKSIVLVFSGQSNNRVELNQSIYNTYHAFRSYIDAVDNELKSLGYGSVFPTIFQREPIDDVVSLQCGIFAAQYACARCWIDAGLTVDAVVGHSLGELSALAVAGVLSLRDCINLVAFRAHLISSRWGTDKGAMLALRATPEDVKKITCRLRATDQHSELEIACYNGTASTVVAGSSELVKELEELLQADVYLQKIKFQRVQTSHGFHSCLAEPILTELNTMSKALAWNDPHIPLEICTEERLGSMKAYSVSEHARRPVFFGNAIRRVEERLGSSIWFEAGMDTAIISMTRKACQYPEIHKYQAAVAKDPHAPDATINNILSSMWQQGISLTHWSFLPKQVARYKQVWLPPYQFDGTSHWLPNIDRTMELRHSLAAPILPESSVPTPNSPPKLVIRKSSTDTRRGVAHFYINTHCRRFQDIVSGHAVRQRPLCPASMYMECVTMGVQLLEEIGDSNLSFEELEFQNALGLEPALEVTLILEELIEKQSWRFKVQSSRQKGSNSRFVVHVTGTLAVFTDPKLNTLQRLVTDSMENLDQKANVEKLLSIRAYALFGSVVDYAPFFRGITSIKLGEREAISEVRLPIEQPGRQESTAWQLCDTVAIDTFIHTLGLLMNSSDAVSKDEVMVATGIECAIILSTSNMDSSTLWRVYARFTLSKDPKILGDVFAFSQDGQLVAMMSGCRFSKLPISKLEKSLDAVNADSIAKKIPSTWDEPSLSSASTIAENSAQTPRSVSGSLGPKAVKVTVNYDLGDVALKKLVAEFTGIVGSEIPQDMTFAELGLDSLASVEMVSELGKNFGLDISTEQIVETTFTALLQALASKKASGRLAATSEAVSESFADSSSVQPPSVEASLQDPAKRQRLLEIIIDASGAILEDIQDHNTLEDLGADSLSLMDMKHQIEMSFPVQLPDGFLASNLTVIDLVQHVIGAKMQLSLSRLNSGVIRPGISSLNTAESRPRALSWSESISEQHGECILPNPFEALSYADSNFEAAAQEQRFSGYWSDVSPVQEGILLAYISEAFHALGVDLSSMPPGTVIPDIPHLPRYEKLMQRLWDILESHSIISRQSGHIVRSHGILDTRGSSQLCEAFKSRFPQYASEADVMELTGPQLASCLNGRIDPKVLMFGSPAALRIIERFYCQSPMFSTLTEQLATFLKALFQSSNANGNARYPVNILEVGAGIGGTTLRLAETLETAGIPVQYTFTDISPNLVSKARRKFGNYTWMSFSTFNLEEEIVDVFRNKFDIVISTMCVHATTNRTMSCRRLRETLKKRGFIVLSEVTRKINWYDICFGLLEGWWLAEDGSSYPLQPASTWMSAFQNAGFISRCFSQAPTLEANTQRLLIGSTKDWKVSTVSAADQTIPQESSFKLETLVYKEVDGVQIHADVYLPLITRETPLPIALMIHGGGYISLSRKYVRPHQTKHLIRNGFLPVSIDYRLCPEVNLIDGPMADARDAYLWVRNTLPSELYDRGLVVDGTKVVVIGWSTGGQMAMSIGWTAREVGIPPPTAVLSFYGPTDFESGELDRPPMCTLPDRQMEMERIISALPASPITSYEAARNDSTNLGWIQPGDPRSELVLSLFKEGTGLPLLLNGLPSITASGSACFEKPSAEQIASINPISQLRSGNYSTPTFIIHGTDDEIAPFTAAEQFLAALKAKNVMCGLLKIEGGKHTHDLTLKPGMKEWEQHVAPGYRFLSEIVAKL